MRIDENSSIDKAFIGNVRCRERTAAKCGASVDFHIRFSKTSTGRSVESARARVRVKSNFVSRFKVILVVSPHSQKFRLRRRASHRH